MNASRDIRRLLWINTAGDKLHKMTEAMEFGFMKGGNDAMNKKRRLGEEGSQTQGSTGAASSGSTTHTEAGIHIQTALLRIKDAIENLELRTRHLETAAYVTLSAPADNVFH